MEWREKMVNFVCILFGKHSPIVKYPYLFFTTLTPVKINYHYQTIMGEWSLTDEKVFSGKKWGSRGVLPL